MERITSKTNQLVKDIKRLITSSKERAEKRLFVLEGARLCFDVLNSVYGVKYFLITDEAYARYSNEAAKLEEKSEKSFLITAELAEKLGETKNTQGVFAVCAMPEEKNLLGDKIIALDSVQDPANMGAIFRTAEALGIDGIVIYNCCDIYNPKTLRASMGGVLRLTPVKSADLVKTLEGLKASHKIYSTVPDSGAKPITELDFSDPCVCVIGNEANGVSNEVKAASDGLITIPMMGNAESLNASVAAAITMWEMMR